MKCNVNHANVIVEANSSWLQFRLDKPGQLVLTSISTYGTLRAKDSTTLYTRPFLKK